MIRLGFAKTDISPPLGTELGGYAGYRPCAGVHDRLQCKAVVLEQEGRRFALVMMDMLCVDESFSHAMALALAPWGIREEDLIVAAIHSHASVCGVVPGEGPLGEINRVGQADPKGFASYIRQAVDAAVQACRTALDGLEPFTVRTARAAAPPIGSERHTGAAASAELTVVQCRTESGRELLLYQIPCHPTVLGPENLLASADFAAGIEGLLDVSMAVFVNGAAGDISTRFTREEASFAQCGRFARMAARQIRAAMETAEYTQPTPLRGWHGRIVLPARPVQTEQACLDQLTQASRRWEEGKKAGLPSGELRILKSYVEGAGVSLELARVMDEIKQFSLPVTVFRFAGLRFYTVPGELFSGLRLPDAVPICYANGYYRYIADRNAYDSGYYEAMAAILDRGAGEAFRENIARLLEQLDTL